MADKNHSEILKQGVEVWNQWRKKDPFLKPDLENADLSGMDLTGANLSRSFLKHSILKNANLTEASLLHSVITFSDLSNAKMVKAWLGAANLYEADLTGADLTNAIIDGASLVRTTVENAIFTGCVIYGISAWDLKGVPRDQSNLVISRAPLLTVDNLEIAQFIYLLLNNEKIRDVIDTIGKKGVLIIGRFTEERKAILYAIRDELKSRYDLLPIMFEFDPLSKEPTIKTLSTLAHLSRFVIADLTDAKSVLQELTTILKELPTLPVKPIIHESGELPPMGDGFLIMQSMLKPYIYSTKKKLIAALKDEVINPAEDCVKSVEAELAEIRQKWFPWQERTSE